MYVKKYLFLCKNYPKYHISLQKDIASVHYNTYNSCHNHGGKLHIVTIAFVYISLKFSTLEKDFNLNH